MTQEYYVPPDNMIAARYLNLRILSEKNEKIVGCIVNEMPHFKTSCLIDDINQCVFVRTKHGVCILPYELNSVMVNW